jgi:hypothetical protein
LALTDEDKAPDSRIRRGSSTYALESDRRTHHEFNVALAPN